MRALVFGKGGQLATHLQKKLAPDYDYLGIENLDLTKSSDLSKYLSSHNYELIINASAYTAVDKAEEEKDKAFQVNAEAVGIMAMHCKHLIHISTDYVFDGNKGGAYTENDRPNPLNIYGASKLAGEKLALENNANSIVIRTSWLYSEYGNNFVKTMLRLGQEKDSLAIVSDQIAAPTYAGDLAQIICKIASEPQNYKSGIYHYCSDGKASWYDFAKEIFRLRNIPMELRPILTKDYPTPAQRPLYSLLDNSKIKHDMDIKIPNWQESLKKCLERMS